jgi:hypothetical protein
MKNTSSLDWNMDSDWNIFFCEKEIVIIFIVYLYSLQK